MRRFTSMCLVLLACGNRPGPGGLEVDVEYSLPGAGGCVRLTALSEGVSKSDDVALGTRPRTGHLFFGVAQGELGREVTLLAGYYEDPCTGPARVSDTEDAVFSANVVTPVSLQLVLPPNGGGQAGGGAAGGGEAGGATAGGAAGGASAGGTTAGGGAAGGTNTAGGGAAGGAVTPALACDGGFIRLMTPMTGTVRDVAIAAPGIVWLASSGSGVHIGRLGADGGFFVPDGGCSDSVYSVWARSEDSAYFGGNNEVIRVPSLAAGCSELVATVHSNVSGLSGFVAANTVELISSHDNGTVGHRFDPSTAGTEVQPLMAARAVASAGRSLVFAVGHGGMMNRARVAMNTGDTGWSTAFTATDNDTVLNDVTLASPSLGWAGGDGDLLYQFDGGTWALSALASPFPGGPGEINGLQVLSDGTLYAVGTSGRIYRSSGGAPFVEVASFAVGQIMRIRGTSQCDLWAVGEDGLVATTNHR
ncbi:MAG: hypothetical protein JNK82_25145 [Myxococcaceae bacterium]|nr:hypothetical protein [Myxococcaceae bacterium]